VTEKGLFEAGNELLLEAVKVPPQAPKLHGDLWGSRRTETLKGTKPGMGIAAGFNMIYAARWHELTPAEDAKINWTRDKGAVSPGAKYLETKMWMFKDKYLKIIGEYLRRFLGGK